MDNSSNMNNTRQDVSNANRRIEFERDEFERNEFERVEFEQNVTNCETCKIHFVLGSMVIFFVTTFIIAMSSTSSRLQITDARKGQEIFNNTIFNNTIYENSAFKNSTFKNSTFKNSTFKRSEPNQEIANQSTTEKNEEKINSTLPKIVLIPTVMSNKTKPISAISMFIRTITIALSIMIFLAYITYWLLNKYCTRANNVQQQEATVQYNPNPSPENQNELGY